MRNDPSGKSAPELALAIEIISRVVRSPDNEYGLGASLLAELAACSAEVHRSLARQGAAANEMRAATEDKLACQAAALAAFQGAIGTAYLSGASDVAIAAIGLAPRRTGHAPPVVLQTPTWLLAEALSDGRVRLRWDRGDNAKSVMFLVEGRAEGGDWTFLRTVKRVSLTLDGFPPGERAWFRVTATTSTRSSTPSQPVPIYAAPSARSALGVAPGLSGRRTRGATRATATQIAPATR